MFEAWPSSFFIMTTDSLTKKREQCALGNRIARFGVEMMPCSFCAKNKKTCLVASSESKRCSECARLGRRCDVEGIPIRDWDTLEQEESRLDSAEMMAEDALRRAQQQAAEALNRLSRLRKQKQFVRRRAAEMLRRGLKTMDELEAAEDKEKLASEGASSNTPAADLPEDPFDPALASALYSFDPDDPYWSGAGFSGVATGDWHAAGGTPLVDPGS